MDENVKKLRRYRRITWAVAVLVAVLVLYTLLMGALPIRLTYALAILVAVAAVVLVVETVYRRARPKTP